LIRYKHVVVAAVLGEPAMRRGDELGLVLFAAAIGMQVSHPAAVALVDLLRAGRLRDAEHLVGASAGQVVETDADHRRSIAC
jgi:cation transport ATPase